MIGLVDSRPGFELRVWDERLFFKHTQLFVNASIRVSSRFPKAKGKTRSCGEILQYCLPLTPLPQWASLNVAIGERQKEERETGATDYKSTHLSFTHTNGTREHHTSSIHFQTCNMQRLLLVLIMLLCCYQKTDINYIRGKKVDSFSKIATHLTFINCPMWLVCTLVGFTPVQMYSSAQEPFTWI